MTSRYLQLSVDIKVAALVLLRASASCFGCGHVYRKVVSYHTRHAKLLSALERESSLSALSDAHSLLLQLLP